MRLTFVFVLLCALAAGNKRVITGAFTPSAQGHSINKNAFVALPSTGLLGGSLTKKPGPAGSTLCLNNVPTQSVDELDDNNAKHETPEELFVYNEVPQESLNLANQDVAPIEGINLEMSFEKRRSEGAFTSEEVSEDPLGFLVKEVKVMDVNSIINTGILLLATVAVLSKLATVDVGIMRGWSAAEMAARIPVDNWNSYSAVLENSPVSTKAITSATVYTIGDMIAQRTEGVTIGELDRPRIVRSLLAGLVGHGPLSHIWYDKSEALFNDVLQWTEWWSVFPKVVLDQTTWGPFWNNMYIVMLGAMKLENPAVIWEDIKRTTIPLVVSGLKLWPLAHCVTYGLVPVENRLLWVDFVEIIWVSILATQAAGGGTAADGHGSSSDAEVETTMEKS